MGQPRTTAAPDAVVIGAGHNGLVAANLLADAGWSVLVCEATSSAGGAVATAEVTAPGFRTDLFSAFYPLTAASPIMRALDLPSFGLRWSRAPVVLAHVLPDGRVAALHQDPAVTAASLARFHEADGDAWFRITRQWERIAEDVLGVLLEPMPPIRPALRALRKLGSADALRLARMAAQPVRRFGEEYFSGAGGPLLFAGNALHADLPPDGAGSALYGYLLTMLGHSYGFPVPVGGASALIDAMLTRLRAKGGELMLDAPVRQVTVRGGTATGVVLADGQRIDARRAVVADVTAPALYLDLVGRNHLPARMADDLDNFQWDTPTLKVDWALRTRVPWDDTTVRQAGTVHLGADMDGLTDYAADLATRRISPRPFVLFGQMTTADATRSPAGTESAWAYTHLPRHRTLTADEIAEHVQRIEETVEAQAPGFRDAVVARHVQSPADLQASNPSLVDGALNGGTAQLHQQLVFRPVPGLGGANTPIDRLFLGSASAHPGGGVHGACGSNAARAALARAGTTGRVRRAVHDLALRRLYRPERG